MTKSSGRPRQKLRLISWNVNGLRAILKKNFYEFIETYQPDILCLQETRARPEDVTLNLEGYEKYWNSAEKKGYSGTAVFTRVPPLGTFDGLQVEKHDSEGRVLTAEFDKFFLVNVYTPNSKRGLERLGYRCDEWDVDFLGFLKRIEKKKPVIFCGDLNVAHREIDLANPRANVKNHGFTPEERRGFDNIVNSGFIDTFREFCPEGGHYTWWSRMHNARARNIGWRIDYFCISRALRPALKTASILKEVMGSDHCPVMIELEL